ncbi:MAG: hypothetical protein RLN72_09670 [Henriciella sp.]
MKQITLAALAALALAACGGNETGDEATQTASPLPDDCVILASDPEAQENFEEMGIDGTQFCDCFVKVVGSKSESQQAQMISTLERVTDGMEETGEGAEEVVGSLMGEIMGATEASTEAQDLSAGIRLIGDAIDDIGNSFEASGSCPVS